jgi:hypothetical protein
MAVKLGMDCKLYRQTTGTRAAWPASGAAPNLDEVTNVKDVTLNLETGEADTTTRGNAGWRTTAATLKDGSVEFEMVGQDTDADFTAFQTAWLNKTSIACAVLNGGSTTAGVEGLWADFAVTNFSRSEPLEEAVAVSVTLKPYASTVAPEWVTVAT